MKYIAYCRKSTDEPDRQILSIEAQIEELKEFAEKEKLEIVFSVVESKTAKEPGREKFNEMLKMIEDGKANGIVSWNPDRLARNSVDGGKIIFLLDTGKLVDLKFPTHWFENTPQGKFMLSIAFGQSKYYVDNLSENVKRGYRQKLRRGEWPHLAPIGYLNDLKTKTIIVDEKIAPLIKKSYELFATGAYSLSQIRNIFSENNIRNKHGKILHLDIIKKILTNCLYIGLMKFNGVLYEGKHTPLVSKKLYDKVQEIINAKTRRNKNQKTNFAFLGMVKCKECGCSITAEKHTKFYKTKNRRAEYVYYCCSKKNGLCNQKYVTDLNMEKQIRDFLRRVSISEFAKNKFLEWAKFDSEKEKQKSSGILQTLNQQLSQVQIKLDKLLEVFLDNLVSKEEYQTKKNKMLEEKISLSQKIAEISRQGNDWLEPFQEFVKKAAEAAKTARAKNNCPDLAIGA